MKKSTQKIFFIAILSSLTVNILFFLFLPKLTSLSREIHANENLKKIESHKINTIFDKRANNDFKKDKSIVKEKSETSISPEKKIIRHQNSINEIKTPIIPIPDIVISNKNEVLDPGSISDIMIANSKIDNQNEGNAKNINKIDLNDNIVKKEFKSSENSGEIMSPKIQSQNVNKKYVYKESEVEVLPQRLDTSKPIYPAAARRANISGYVKLEFTVDLNGRAVDIVIIESKPKKIFDSSAFSAAENWRFIPAYKSGQKVESRNTLRIDYKP